MSGHVNCGCEIASMLAMSQHVTASQPQLARPMACIIAILLNIYVLWFIFSFLPPWLEMQEEESLAFNHPRDDSRAHDKRR
jgi:hypothetical protein